MAFAGLTARREMGTLELEETPPLVYQLLLLSLKGYKGEILRGIVEHFQSLDQQGHEESVRERYAPVACMRL